MSARLPAAGFVLVGGRSRRLGADKALLTLGGQSLVLRAAERLRPVVGELVLVGSPQRYAHLGLPVLADRVVDRGPLAGIVAALAATGHDWNLVAACDLPFLETRFFEFLLQQAAEKPASDALVPRVGGFWQPLAAAYHRRALPAFERVLASGTPKIDLAFPDLHVEALTDELLDRVAFPERMFKNINTREDYEEALRELARRGELGA